MGGVLPPLLLLHRSSVEHEATKCDGYEARAYWHHPDIRSITAFHRPFVNRTQGSRGRGDKPGAHVDNDGRLGSTPRRKVKSSINRLPFGESEVLWQFLLQKVDMTQRSSESRQLLHVASQPAREDAEQASTARKKESAGRGRE